MMDSLERSLGADLAHFGGFLRCEQCGHSAELGNPGRRVMGGEGGWPKHCGYTMQWWTQRQIDDGEVTRIPRV